MAFEHSSALALHALHAVALMVVIICHAPSAKAHGVLGVPNQRGSLATTAFVKGVDENAPKDFKPHFPAGDKDPEPGAAARSQIREAGPKGWTPFRPLEKAFKWRAGVCGDLKGPRQAHRRGGRYYYGGKIVRTYKQGAVLAAQVNIVSNHGGFFEFHICDVSKCGGEISEDCFRHGHCHQLQRTPNPACDEGNNPLCAPVDPNYPDRWYMPCTTLPQSNHGREYFGGNTMLYDLPENLNCKHCVLQWFWSTGNTCNAPGVIDYFDGPNQPNWGSCIGQGGAIGGVTREQKPCGPDRFPEEYLECADIAIESSDVLQDAAKASETPSASNSPGAPGAPGAPVPERTPVVGPIPSLEAHMEPSQGPFPSMSPRVTVMAEPVGTPESEEMEVESSPVGVLVESSAPALTPADPTATPNSDSVPVPAHQPPEADLVIPDGYPAGIYGPKPASRVSEWDSFKWAAVERARRREKGPTPMPKEPQLIIRPHDASVKHLEGQAFEWAAAERARRQALSPSPQPTYSQQVFTEGDSSMEQHPKQGLQMHHLESFKWAAEERARRQGGQRAREFDRR